MSIILAIESSAANCSVSLRCGDAYYSRSATGQRSHTEFLLAFIDEVITEANIVAADIDAVAFSAGPGAFTGIRLACSVAKSFAYALSIPVIAISTLEVAAFTYLAANPTQRVAVVSDARMGDVYLGYYGFSNGLTHMLAADAMLKLDELSEALPVADALLSDCKALLQSDNAGLSSLVHHDIVLAAKAVADIAKHKLANGEDLQSALTAEAIYLRDKRSWKNTAQQKAHRESLQKNTQPNAKSAS